MTTWHECASDLLHTARRMAELGINNGTSGNVSWRHQDTMLITPSGAAYDTMTPNDIVTMHFDESWESASGQVPSSEWRFHLDILRARPEVNAVVHSHPVNATALASHRMGITSFHYMVAVAGGIDIRCADYATFGTSALSANVVAALEDRTACLMANHGIIAVGSTLTNALNLAVEVEVLASQYIAARVLGEPVQLSESEMAEVSAKMNAGVGYGSYERPMKEL